MKTMNKKKRQALHDRQDGLCALCNIPLPDSKSSVYDKRHNILTCRGCAMLIYSNRSNTERGVAYGAFVMFEAQKHTDPERRNKPMYKTRRRLLLDDQDHRCVMCNELMSGPKSSCYDPCHNVFVCYRCMMFITVWRKAPDRGVTFEILAAYEARERADDPQY